MNKEMLMIISMGCGGVLFAIGGTGFKWARRFVLPVILGIIAIIGGIIYYKAIAMTICLIGAMCLPYGERTNYWVKTLVFIAMFGSTLWCGFTYWQIIGAVLTIILFKLSNMKWTQNIVFWKAWEFITGALLGITVASLIRG